MVGAAIKRECGPYTVKPQHGAQRGLYTAASVAFERRLVA